MNIKEFKKLYLEKWYLGDGLYVHFDGYHLILSSERENGVHWVGLDPSVFHNLISYQEKLYKYAEKIVKDYINE